MKTQLLPTFGNLAGRKPPDVGRALADPRNQTGGDDQRATASPNRGDDDDGRPLLGLARFHRRGPAPAADEAAPEEAAPIEYGAAPAEVGFVKIS